MDIRDGGKRQEARGKRQKWIFRPVEVLLKV
jgi:hypothetical protein